MNTHTGRMVVRFAGRDWRVDSGRFRRMRWIIVDPREWTLEAYSPVWGSLDDMLGRGRFAEFVGDAGSLDELAVRGQADMRLLVPGAGWFLGRFAGEGLPFGRLLIAAVPACESLGLPSGCPATGDTDRR